MTEFITLYTSFVQRFRRRIWNEWKGKLGVAATVLRALAGFAYVLWGGVHFGFQSPSGREICLCLRKNRGLVIATPG